jgi:hypothetical protein
VEAVELAKEVDYVGDMLERFGDEHQVTLAFDLCLVREQPSAQVRAQRLECLRVPVQAVERDAVRIEVLGLQSQHLPLALAPLPARDQARARRRSAVLVR